MWLVWRRMLQCAHPHLSDVQSSCSSVSPSTSRAIRSYSVSNSGNSALAGTSSGIRSALIYFTSGVIIGVLIGVIIVEVQVGWDFIITRACPFTLHERV